MKKIIRLIILALVIFLIVKITTFGRVMLPRQQVHYMQGNSELAKNLELHVKKLSDEIGERS